MKKYAVLLVALVVGGLSQLHAQSSDAEDLAIIQSIFGKEKKEIIASYMKLDSVKAPKFWSLYNDYEAERRNLVKERLQGVKEFAQKYDSFNDVSAKALMDNILSNDVQMSKLQKKYFDKMTSGIGGYQAAKFFQMERYIEDLVHAKVQENIPFIGDLEKSMKK